MREEGDSTSFYSIYHKHWSGIAQFAWETNECLKVPMKPRITMSKCEKGHDRHVNNQIVTRLLDNTLS